MSQPVRVILLSAAVGFCCPCILAQDIAKKNPGEELARQIAVASAQQSLVPGQALAQHPQALELWKLLYAKDEVPSAETANFLLYGRLGTTKKLAEVGLALEAQRTLALKALEMQWDPPPWPGKMAVFLFTERRECLTFSRSALKSRLEDTDQGQYVVDGDLPVIVAGPPMSKIDLTPDRNAGEQLGAALLYKKGGNVVPSWVLSGFGRALVMKSNLADYGLEHRRAAKMLSTRKFTLQEILQPGLSNDEAVVLKASLIEYLALSGRTRTFLPFIKGFKPTEDVAEPTAEQALKSTGLMLEKLDPLWQAWARGFK